MPIKQILLTPFRFIATFLIWLIAKAGIHLLGYVVVPIGLLFCNRKSEHMPILFWPWDNVAGINGTLNGMNPKWPSEAPGGDNRSFWSRYIWLAHRNPTSNWGRYVLGVKLKEPIKKWGTEDPLTTGGASLGVSGWKWDYHIVIPYGNGKGFRIRLGWKLSRTLNDEIERGEEVRTTFQFTWTPGKTMDDYKKED